MKFYKSFLVATLLAGGFSYHAMSQQLPLEWAYNMPGSGGDTGKDIVTDASGNILLLGEFSATVDFEPGVGVTNLTSAGSVDVSVSKYDPDGNLIWAVRMGGTGSDVPVSLDVDNGGNVYVCGYFNATADFDPGIGTANLTPFGMNDGFVLKLDQDGNFVWVKQIGSTGNDTALSLAVDPSGNVLISGYFAGTVDFDPNAGVVNSTSAGLADAYVLKLNAAGDFVWHYVFGAVDSDDARALTTDAGGNVYVTGYFEGTVDFDFSGATQNLVGTGVSEEIFVLKITAAGNYVAAVGTGSTGFESGREIHIDSNNDILVTGYFSGTVDFDPGVGTNTKTSGGLRDIFVLKLDNSLNHIWAAHAGGVSDDEGYTIATDNINNVFVAGFFRNTVDFDPGAGTQNVTVAGGGTFADQFYWKLDSDGNYLSADKAGSGGNDHSFAFYPSGNHAYITGYLQGTSDYDFESGVTNLTSAGSGDIYLAKYYNCNPIHTNDVIVSCGSITWIDGNTYSADNNSATHMLTSINGCDSIVHLNLKIKSIDDQTVVPSATTLCDNGNVTVGLGASQTGVFYSLVDQSTMNVIDGPLEGNGSALTLDAGNITTTTTYEVQAERNKYNTLTFTGNSPTPSHVSLGTDMNKVFAGTTAITVEAWINSDNNNNHQSVVSTYNGLGNTMQFLLRLDQVAGQNKATFWVGNGTTPGSYVQVIGTTTILPGTWYHLAATYDGTNVSIYVNGVLENQIALTTPIPDVTNELRIGGGLDNDTEYFYGDITGVRLWNVARTQTEISDNMNLCIPGNENGLVAMYNMVDGTGSSTLTDESVNGYDGTLTNMDANTSWNYTNMPAITCSMCNTTMTQTATVTVNYVTTGTDVQEHCVNYTWIDGNTYTASNTTATHTLTNMAGCDSVVTLNLTINTPDATTDTQMACESYTWIDGNTYTADNNVATFTLSNMNGCDSVVTLNLTILTPDATTDTQTACESYTWIDGNTYTADNNIATFTLANMAGCDSVVTLNLTIETPPTAAATNNGDGTLSASGTGTYQWIDCGTNTPVSGATAATFIPTVNGDYAVIVTNGSCDDTSSCVTYNSVGLNENNSVVFTVYPNPTNGLLQISFGIELNDAYVVITNVLGEQVYTANVSGTTKHELNLEQSNGIYFVNVYTQGNLVSTARVIKQ